MVGSVSVVVGEVTVPKIEASCRSASRWLFYRGAKREGGDGCNSACVRSWAAAIAKSVDEAVGIVIC